MRVQYFKQIIGISFLILFIGGAIYKITTNSGNAALYLMIGLIIILIIWGVVRLLSE